MSIAPTASARPVVLDTTTVRQFLRAVAVALGAVGVGCLIYVSETFILDLDRRFVENPTDVMMRAFAMAHFVIGWLFLFTSPRIRNRVALGRIALATAAGVLLCLLFAEYGGTSNPLLVMFFYSYFLVHEIRDETQLYRTYGDAPRTAEDIQSFLRSLAHAASLVLMTALVVSYALHAVALGKSTPLDYLPASVLIGGMALLGGVCLWVFGDAYRHGCRLHGDGRSTLAAHLPLLLVYAIILGILLIGSPLGSAAFNFIILVHVTSWFVFVPFQLARRPPASARTIWGWLRGTPVGFVVLHLAVFLLFLVLMGVRVHVWQRVGLLSELLASANFCYWGLMHISIAFWSR